MTKRLLVVDDSILDIALTLQALNACLVDHVIESAADGADAYRLLSERQYDCVILDIKMPRVDGFELLRWMNRNSARRVPVIVVSGSVLESDKYLSLKLGAIDYVEKAIDFAVFKASVQAALRQQGLC